MVVGVVSVSEHRVDVLVLGAVAGLLVGSSVDHADAVLTSGAPHQDARDQHVRVLAHRDLHVEREMRSSVGAGALTVIGIRCVPLLRVLWVIQWFSGIKKTGILRAGTVS